MRVVLAEDSVLLREGLIRLLGSAGMEVVAAVAVRDPQQAVGAAAAQNVRNFYVVAADPAAKTVSVVDSNGGEVRTFSVSDAVAQAELPLMRPGYKLTVIDVQAMVVAIEKQV